MSVQELTKTWIEQLPSDHSMIGKELLERSSWPDFLVRWVEEGVAAWIRESLTLPDIPLARMDEEEILESWHTFETTVVRHWALPAEEMQTLLEELAEELLALLGRPEERIPDLLFGSETSIDRNLLAARLGRVVVHQDLARALLRYAERKELGTVDRELAGRVISQVDQKLKEQYDADAWANQLRPLVALWGGSVPSGMIRTLLKARGAEGADRIPAGSERRTIEWVTDQLREGTVAEPAIEEDPRTEDSDGDEGALHRRFQFDEPDLDRYLEEQEADPEESDAPRSVNPANGAENEASDPGSPNAEETSTSGEEDSLPVEWLDPAESGFNRESKKRVRELEQWLGKEFDRFRQEIFEGSEEGLRDALQDLSQLGSWGDAARYLQDDVFDRYRIDLFDDAAVDFTDRMQAWFEDVDQPRS